VPVEAPRFRGLGGFRKLALAAGTAVDHAVLSSLTGGGVAHQALTAGAEIDDLGHPGMVPRNEE
jgi:hypothetical protein